MDEALLMRYLEHARACGEKLGTLERRQFWVQLFCAHFRERGWGLEELTRERLEECTQWLLWTPHAGGKLRSPNTVYQGMAMLRQFLRWAAAQGVFENPTSGWLLSRPTARERVILTRAQVDAIPRARRLGCGTAPFCTRWPSWDFTAGLAPSSTWPTWTWPTTSCAACG